MRGKRMLVFERRPPVNADAPSRTRKQLRLPVAHTGMHPPPRSRAAARVCRSLLRAVAAVAALVCVAAFAATAPVCGTVARLQSEARGLYLLWAEKHADEEALLRLPFVRGGQVVVQWAELEPRPGAYDFSQLDAKLARYAGLGKWATVQVNGNAKPAWLFDVVPHVPEKLSEQVRDRRGSLLFWHPRFQEAHLAMIAAVGKHLRGSASGERLLGVRLNFNALGTEHLVVPDAYRNPSRWTFPAGEPRDASLPSYSDAVRADYSRRVVDAYVRAFSDWTVVFLRNNFDPELIPGLEADLRAGRIGLFHTSSEAEPRASGVERQYVRFLDYARPGHTLAYAEPWASAWGEHGGQVDPRWCSAAQWNYWTLLLNLHCGVSFIGEYAANLAFALNGRAKLAKPVDRPEAFMAAYEWGAAYAGLHNRPEISPGAWVAFRANALAKADNPKVPPKGRALSVITGDYTRLAQRADDDGSVGVGPVGPAEQPYGAFARRWPAGGAARVWLDPDFLGSLLQRRPAGASSLQVIWLDEPGGAGGVVSFGGAELGALRPRGTGRWETASFPLSKERLAAAIAADATPTAAKSGTGRATRDAHIEVIAGAAPLTLHRIEVRR